MSHIAFVHITFNTMSKHETKRALKQLLQDTEYEIEEIIEEDSLADLIINPPESWKGFDNYPGHPL